MSAIGPRSTVGLVAAALIAGVLAVATPVFAGSTGRRASRAGPTAVVTLAVVPSRSRKPAAPARAPTSAAPLRHGRGGGLTGVVTLAITPGHSRKPTVPAPKTHPPGRRRLGASSTTSSSTPARANPMAVTASRLRAIAASARHPIYWAGTVTGTTYELTTIAAKRAYILRYLPPGVALGDRRHAYLTIGTYLVSSRPYAAVRAAAVAQHATIRSVAGGALAVVYRASPRTVYMVFPGTDYEVEVYDPSAATAFRVATTGTVVPIPGRTSTPPRR